MERRFKFKEVTKDNGWAKTCFASDNNALYIITSTMAHELHREFIERHNRVPSSRWYNRHFKFERI